MKTPFRGFTAILYKEFLVVLRDPFTLFFMIFPPLVEMIAFGYALDTDVKNLSMVVLNEWLFRTNCCHRVAGTVLYGPRVSMSFTRSK